MVTKRLHKLKQTCSWKLHVCLKYGWPFCYHQALKGLDMVTRLILKNFVNILRIHCVKSVQIRNFFWSVFPAFSPNTGKYWPKGHSSPNFMIKKFQKVDWVIVQWSHDLNERNSQQRCCVKKIIFENFAKFTGKHLCWSLFLSRSQACNFIKKETPTKVFSGDFAKFWKSPFLQNAFGRLLLQWSGCWIPYPGPWVLNLWQTPKLTQSFILPRCGLTVSS